MSIVVTNLTVLGTAVPWTFGGTTVNAGPGNVLASQNSGYCDGSAAQLPAISTVNLAYVFGQLHTHAGETGPTTLAVTPGQFLFIEYVSGTVQTQGGGAGNSPPTGSPSTSLTPNPGHETDVQGYVLPVDRIPGRLGFNMNGTCNTSGTAVTLTAGQVDVRMVGKVVWINNAAFTVASVNIGANTLVTTATAGTNTGVSIFFYSAPTSIGGLVGGFTDSSGNIIAGSLFDWSGWGGTASANSTIGLIVPPGAAFLTLGINDSILYDNTGSFSLTVLQDDWTMFVGDQTAPSRFPIGLCTVRGMQDTNALRSLVWLQTYLTPLFDFTTLGWMQGYIGQLFPHGAQNTGGAPNGSNGQNFPY